MKLISLCSVLFISASLVRGEAEELFAIVEREMEKAELPPTTGTSRALPEDPSQIVPAYGGLYLLLVFPELGKIGVFNVVTGEISNYIDLKSKNSVVGAGGTRMVIHYPEQEVTELWDLSTFTKTGAAMTNLPAPIDKLEMPILRDDMALISWQGERSSSDSNRHYGIMKFPSCGVQQLDRSAGIKTTTFSNEIDIRIDPVGKRFTVWQPATSPKGFIFGRLLEDGKNESLHKHENYGALTFGMCSKIIGSSGYILTETGRVTERIDGTLVPVEGADAVVKQERGKATVIDLATRLELASLTLPSFRIESWEKRRTAYASAYLNRFIVLDPTAPALHLFPLADLSTDVVKDLFSGIIPGKEWRRQISLSEQATVEMEDAPQGMVFNPETKTLSWNVPAEAPPGKTYLALLYVSDPGFDDRYERIHVRIARP